MAGLPYAQLSQDSPESIVDDYLQRGMRDMQKRFETQWNEVNSRAGTLGRRKQVELLTELQSKATNEMMKFQQSARQQSDRLAQLDRLAKQGGFDPSEAKWRMVLGPEEAAAMFQKPEELEAPPDPLTRLNKLDVTMGKMKADRDRFKMIPGERIPEFWTRASKEKRKPATLQIWDRSLNPEKDKKTGEWISGGYRPVTPEEKQYYDTIGPAIKETRSERQDIMRELGSLPDIGTRIQTTMFRGKRDPVHNSLTTRVQEAAQTSAPKPSAPRKTTPERQPMQPTAEQLKKINTKEAYETGVRLGYWE